MARQQQTRETTTTQSETPSIEDRIADIEQALREHQIYSQRKPAPELLPAPEVVRVTETEALDYGGGFSTTRHPTFD